MTQKALNERSEHLGRVSNQILVMLIGNFKGTLGQALLQEPVHPIIRGERLHVDHVNWRVHKMRILAPDGRFKRRRGQVILLIFNYLK